MKPSTCCNRAYLVTGDYRSEKAQRAYANRPPFTVDLVGKRFLRLTVLSFQGKSGRHNLWLCACDCGGTKIAKGGDLASGDTKSCGCWHREAMRFRVHGMQSHGMTQTPTYLTWRSMHARCRNPNAADYARYGGRGIEVCKRWDAFEAFLADMGERPTGMTIERDNVNGNYAPENCRWATRTEQCRNKRSNVVLTMAGVSATLAEWEERIGISQKVLGQRIRKGWPVERALTEPLNVSQSRKRS